jgi:hypothetical protein
MGPGRKAKISQSAKISRPQAAQLVNVDVSGIDRARKIVKRGAHEVIAAVERGDLSVAAAAEFMELPKSVQLEALMAKASALARPAPAMAKAIEARRSSAAKAGAVPPAFIESNRRSAQNVCAYDVTLRCFAELVVPLYRDAEAFARVQIRKDINRIFDDVDRHGVEIARGEKIWAQ